MPIIETCTGCSACANICPVNAIKLSENDIGYYHAVIDQDKCIHCGKCTKICPEMHTRPKENKNPQVYACQANDEIRYVSSSGGVFSLLAEEILKNNGYIVGVEFDKNWRVQHTIINNINDLDKLRRSKYVQSYIREDLYKEIETILKNGNYVLFTGCPCQVAGLKSYLNKEYEKLILVDLLCAHSASPKAYQKFLNDTFPKEKIKSINFRSKIKGWDAHTVVITDKHPKEEITHSFMRAFVPHLLMNRCCSNCKYTNASREGDLTLGDYWKIGARAPHLDDRKGTSCVLVNTKKGEDLFSKIKSKFKLVEKRTLKDAKKSNWVLSKPFSPHPNITWFNKNLEIKNFDDNTNDCLSKKYNVAVMGWFWVPNRGAILTNYALNEAIKELGYNVKTINYMEPHLQKICYKNSIAEKFAKKYLSLTNKITTRNGLVNLNKRFDTFIVGSDQLWRWLFKKHPLGHLFLNFVDFDKKIISYATSFGTEKYDGPKYAKQLRQFYLKRFDAISVRETSALSVLKNDFGIDGTQVLDPVFLIDKSKYEKIAQDSKQKDTNYIAYYFIFSNKRKENVVKLAEQHYKTRSIDIKQDLPVEDWLYYIKNCNILITDSFHGTCFATIFNKKFIAINIIDEKPVRFETILNITNMQDRFLYKPEEIENKKYLFDDIDWKVANINLEKEIIRSKNWLKDVLEMQPQKQYSKTEEVIDSLINSIECEIDEYNKNLDIMSNKNKIYIKYYTAKILYNFTFGKLKTYCKNIKYKYRPMIRTIKHIKNSI